MKKISYWVREKVYRGNGRFVWTVVGKYGSLSTAISAAVKLRGCEREVVTAESDGTSFIIGHIASWPRGDEGGEGSQDTWLDIEPDFLEN